MSLWSLIVKVKGDNSGLKDSLKDSERQVNTFGSTINKIGGFLKGAFAVGAIVAFGKKVIESSEGLSDKFGAAIAGVKGALFEFNKALGSGSFKGFIDNLIEGYKRAKNLEEKLDALADKSAFVSFNVSQQKYTSADLQEVVKNQELTISERQKAARELQKIEKEIKDSTEKLNEETFALEKQAWFDRNKMSADEATKLYNKVIEIGTTKQEEAFKAFEKIVKEHGLPELLKKQFDNDTYYRDVNMMGTELNPLLKYFKLLQVGEQDVIPKLFSMYEKYNTSKTEAQLRYNGILRITSGLLNKEIEDLNKVEGVSPVPIPGMKSVRTAIKGTAQKALEGDNTGIREFNTELDRDLTEMEKLLRSGVDMASSLAGQLAESIGAALGSGNFEDIGKELLASFANFLSQFGSMLVAFGIANSAFYKSLTAGPLGGPIAGAAGTALLVAAGAIKGAMSKAASGGINTSSSYGNSQMQTIKVQVEGKIKGKDIGIALQRSGY